MRTTDRLRRIFVKLIAGESVGVILEEDDTDSLTLRNADAVSLVLPLSRMDLDSTVVALADPLSVADKLPPPPPPRLGVCNAVAEEKNDTDTLIV